MARLVWLASLALLTAGCAGAVQERVREYNEDGVQLFRKGAYADARDSFQAALALKPVDANMQFNLGQCYDHLNQYDRAEKSYRACLATDPDHKECRHALVVLLWRQNRREDTARLIEDWLVKEPQRAAPYAEHGWLWRQLGDLPRAHARLQQALSLDPADHRALIEMGLVYEEMNRPDRALFLYERALETQPGQAEIELRVTSLKARGVGQPKPD